MEEITLDGADSTAIRKRVDDPSQLLTRVEKQPTLAAARFANASQNWRSL